MIIGSLVYVAMFFCGIAASNALFRLLVRWFLSPSKNDRGENE